MNGLCRTGWPQWASSTAAARNGRLPRSRSTSAWCTGSPMVTHLAGGYGGIDIAGEIVRYAIESGRRAHTSTHLHPHEERACT